MTDFQIALVSTIIGAFIGLVVSVVTYKKARKHDKETASCELFNQLMKDVFNNIYNIAPKDIIKDIIDEKLSYPDKFLYQTNSNYDDIAKKAKENREIYKFYLININSTCKQLKRGAADKDTFAYLFNDVAYARIMQRIYNISELFGMQKQSQNTDDDYASYYSKELKEILYFKSNSFILNTKDNKYNWEDKFISYENGMRAHMHKILLNVMDNIINDYTNNKAFSKYIQLLESLDGYGFKELIISDNDKTDDINKKYFDNNSIVQCLYNDLLNYNSNIKNIKQENKEYRDSIIQKYFALWKI